MRLVSEICPIIPTECEEWLTNIGFYNKPASLHFHGMRSGDLYRHSLEVAMQLNNLTNSLELVWKRKESPLLVGLLHDVCKCDDYVLHNRKWVSNENKSVGHGEKSIAMLENRIELTDEEIACIRYHMGAFVDKEEWGAYTRAVQTYPNVLFTHTADMIASQLLGI